MNDTSQRQFAEYLPIAVTRESLKDLLSTEGFLCAQHRQGRNQQATDFLSPGSTHRHVTQSLSQARWGNMKIKKYDSSRGWGQLTAGKPDVTSSRGFFKPKRESPAGPNFDDRVDSVLRVYPEDSPE